MFTGPLPLSRSRAGFPWMRLPIAVLSLVAVVTGLPAFLLDSERTAGQLDLVQWTCSCTAAFLLAAARNADSGDKEHRPEDRYFVAATAALLLGQLVWDVQALARWNLFPSPADFVYLLAGPLLLAGIWSLGRSELPSKARRTVFLDAGALSVGMFTACLALLLHAPHPYSVLQVLVLATYSLVFIAPASLGVVMVLTRRARPSFSSLLLPLTSLALAAWWAAWNRQFLEGAIDNGGWLSFGFTVGFIGIGAGILLYRLDAYPGRRWDRACEAILRLLPLFMVIAASGGIIALHVVDVSELGRKAGVAGGVVVVTLAMIRQSFLLEEHDRLIEAERQLKEREVELEQRVRSRTEQLAQATERALEASRAKGEFLANMSHEMRTPLNSVLGLSYLALQESEVPPAVRQYLQRIRLSGAHLLRLIDDVLQMSRIDAGEVQLESLPMDLADVSASVHNEVDVAAAQKGLKISWSIDDAAQGMFMGDAFRLKQILLNLVSNAVKFTERGEIRARVSLVGREEEQDLVRFDVEDSGPGVDSAAIHRIFEPFQQADNSTTRRFGGTGLGLAITRRLLQAMGSDIQVESRSGAGSRFWFTVRLSRHQPGPLKPATAPTQPSTRPTGQRRILLTEDNETNRLVATAMLEQLGAEVTVASDGHEAVAALKEGSFDLVLMDVHMPGLDGLEVTRWARTQKQLSQVPIVAMTASVLDEDRRACHEAGMNDFIPKPIDPKRLSTLLAKLAPGQTSASD